MPISIVWTPNETTRHTVSLIRIESNRGDVNQIKAGKRMSKRTKQTGLTIQPLYKTRLKIAKENIGLR
jgi:hypothetical protein